MNSNIVYHHDHVEIENRKRTRSTIEERTKAGYLWINRQHTLSEIQCITGCTSGTTRRAAFDLMTIKQIRSVGRPPALSNTDELALAAWARWCHSCQLPRTSSLIKQTAEKIALLRCELSSNVKFGRKWWKLFRERHQLKMTRARRLELSPPTVSMYNSWMKYFGELLSKYPINRIFNCDETGMFNLNSY